MIRLFVGLELDEATADALADLSEGLPGARWIEERNFHVTLRFIGDIEEGLAEELHESLSAISAPAFTMAVTEFGTFGGGKPRALWAGIRKSPELARLKDKVEQAVVRVGLPPEPRRFTPHVTLARLTDAPVGRLREFIMRHSPLKVGPVPVECFTLFRSHLGRSGAEYEALARYPLHLASSSQG